MLLPDMLASWAPDLWHIGSNLVCGLAPHDPLEPAPLRARFTWLARMHLRGTWGSPQRSACVCRRYSHSMHYLWAVARLLGWLPFQEALRETVDHLWTCCSSQEVAAFVRRWYVPVCVLLLSYLPTCGQHIPGKLQPLL